MAAPIERHILRHRVTPLEVLACGEGDPLVLLHGWGLAGQAYRGAIRALAADGWRVFAPTLRIAERWSVPLAADLCAETMAGMDVASATVVGHSYGGMVGVATALSHPGFVSELIAVSTPFVPIRSLGVRRFLAPGRQYRLAGHLSAARAMAKTAASPGGIANLTRIARWFMDDERADIREGLDNLTLPRALVWAEDDALFPIEIGKASAQMLGGEFVIVDSTKHRHVDHDWPMRQPEHFAQIIGGLARVLRADATKRPRRRAAD